MAELPGPAGEPAGRGPIAPVPDPRWRGTFLLLLLITGLGVTALQAARPMVTYRAIGLGASPVEIGLVQSSFSILPALLAVLVGRWVDRIGEVAILTFGVAMVALGGLTSAFSASLLMLAVAQLITGLGDITHIVASQALTANQGPRAQREHRYGWYAVVVSVGQLVGPLAGAVLVGGTAGLLAAGSRPLGSGLFELNAETPVFLFSATAAGLASLLAFGLRARVRKPGLRAETGGSPPTEGTAVLQVLRRPGMAAAMLVSITAISTVDVLVAYLPAHGEARGISVEVVGALLSVRAGSSLFARLFMGWLIDRMGRRGLLATSLAMSGVGVALLPVVSAVPMLFGLMILIGLGIGFGQPMTLAWVANRSLRRERGLALGVRLTGNRGALLVVPTLMGAIAGAAGINAIWIATAGALGIGTVVARRTPFDELDAEGPAGIPPGEPEKGPDGLSGPFSLARRYVRDASPSHHPR